MSFGRKMRFTKISKHDYWEEEGGEKKEKMACCSYLLHPNFASVTFAVQNFVSVEYF
jgi:hypothetical protein